MAEIINIYYLKLWGLMGVKMSAELIVLKN